MRSLKWKSAAIAVGITLALTATATAVRRSVPKTFAIAARTQASAASDNLPVIRFVKDPESAPPFQARDLNGKAISNADWKGKVVIVNFWATWCGPCRIEIPILKSLQAKYKDQLQIIAVSVDEDPAAKILAFTKLEELNYTVVMSTSAISKAWGGDLVLPTAFIIDTQGRVMQRHTGVYSQELYDREIRALLGIPIDARIETFADTGQVMLKNVAKATSLPGVPLEGLTDEQKKAVLHRLNAEPCTCGCNLTLAQCRVNEDTCPVSLKLAAQVVQEVKEGKTAPASPAVKPTSAKP